MTNPPPESSVGPGAPQAPGASVSLANMLPPAARRFLAECRVRRRPLLLFVGAVAAVAIVLSLLMPPVYRAVSTILPPTESGDSFSLMAGMIESSALTRLGLTSTSSPSEVYAEILKSRTLRESLVVAFDLQRFHKMPDMDRTLGIVNAQIRVDVNPAGVLSVSVDDRDPKRAADMANHLVASLDRFNQESYNTRAKRTRQFLEIRLSEAQHRQREADSALAAYERRHKVLAGGDAAALQGAASVIAQKLDLQVRRAYVGSYSRPGSASLRELDAELGAVEREISKLPGLKEEGSRLALSAEIQRRVYMLLTSQYEDARIQETRDTPTLTVLDRARPPQLKARPKRAIIVLGATAMAMMMGAAWVALSIRTTAVP